MTDPSPSSALPPELVERCGADTDDEMSICCCAGVPGHEGIHRCVCGATWRQRGATEAQVPRQGFARVRRLIGNRTRRLGVCRTSDYAIALAFSRCGELSRGELARLLRVHPSSINYAPRGMEKRGLLVRERQRNPATWRISQEGREWIRGREAQP